MQESKYSSSPVKELKILAQNYSPDAIIATPIKDKAVIQNLQSEGI